MIDSFIYAQIRTQRRKNEVLRFHENNCGVEKTQGYTATYYREQCIRFVCQNNLSLTHCLLNTFTVDIVLIVLLK